LWLRHPDGSTDPTQLAEWDSYCGFERVVRFPELDLIGRLAALNDPDLPHPGLAMALLAPYLMIGNGDDIDVAVPMLLAAFAQVRAANQMPTDDSRDPDDPQDRSLRRVHLQLPGMADWSRPCEEAAELARLESWNKLFIEEDIRSSIVERCDERPDLHWHHDPTIGWYPDSTPENRQLAGVRHPDHKPSFPFRAWQQFIQHATVAYRAHTDQPWRHAVLPLARRIHDEGDLRLATRLADELRAAGCTHPTILRSLAPTAPPTQAGWVVELLADTEPGSLLRRCVGPTSWPSDTDLAAFTRRTYHDMRVDVSTRQDNSEHVEKVLHHIGDALHAAHLALLALEVSTSTACRSVLTPPGPGGHPSVGGS
jgi:hypothetical protein